LSHISEEEPDPVKREQQALFKAKTATVSVIGGLLMVIQFVIGDNYCYADDYRYALLIHAL
jgi:hypothetical protein